MWRNENPNRTSNPLAMSAHAANSLAAQSPERVSAGTCDADASRGEVVGESNGRPEITSNVENHTANRVIELRVPKTRKTLQLRPAKPNPSTKVLSPRLATI